MMWNDYGMMNSFGGIMMMIIFLILAGAVIYFIIITQKKDNLFSRINNDTPLDILKKRYANGEITRDEFERVKKDFL